jgi:hypothetical protein
MELVPAGKLLNEAAHLVFFKAHTAFLLLLISLILP